MEASPSRTAEREAFYKEISPHNLAPLWDVLHTVVTKEPVSPAKPAIATTANRTAGHRMTASTDRPRHYSR